jgi:hypothetical protein
MGFGLPPKQKKELGEIAQGGQQKSNPPDIQAGINKPTA